MRLRPSIWLLLGSLVLGGLALGAGCRSIALPVAPPRSTPLRPLWSNESLREHLEFFNGSDVAGRATGTSGYATAAAYVAARPRSRCAWASSVFNRRWLGTLG